MRENDGKKDGGGEKRGLRRAYLWFSVRPTPPDCA